ncbi:MAG: U32 family peptidase [Clostridia bacterium]
MLELLAPAGDFSKLQTAFHYGADAVYLGGNAFGLRASAKNFDAEQLKIAVDYAHSLGKKVFITVNIFAYNSDFEPLKDYLIYLQSIDVDAVIISDAGVLAFCKQVAPKLQIHLSTQANTTNKYSAKFWAEQGVSRIVLARETCLEDIAEIKDFLPNEVELEAFVHGAMCISYSGRCLLSNFLTKRNGNRGECVQACRWEYDITEHTHHDGKKLTIGEDDRGTYILNSKDLNMIEHIDKLAKAGVTSFKIEGRMKSQYYVGSVVNAYRKAIDCYNNAPDNYKIDSSLIEELQKNSHRDFTTGFYFKDTDNVCLETSQPKCDYEFIAEVKGYDKQKKLLTVEQRNRFKVGDSLEILSNNSKYFNKTLTITSMFDEKNLPIDDAKNVQQILNIPCEMELSAMDILRKGAVKND